MQIESVGIQNFRKLKQCNIEFAKNKTLFVGANNSGKTSAMDALINFLQEEKNFCTTDFTLSNWIDINEKNYDEKTTENGNVRIAYQYGININWPGEELTEEAFPYTFEDALVLTNLEWFKAQKDTAGLMKKMVEASLLPSLNDAQLAMLEALAKGSKAEMALELLCLYPTDKDRDATQTAETPNKLVTPEYIAEGLKWLEDKLTTIAKNQQIN